MASLETTSRYTEDDKRLVAVERIEKRAMVLTTKGRQPKPPPQFVPIS
jgi:hypothetical protein